MIGAALSRCYAATTLTQRSCRLRCKTVGRNLNLATLWNRAGKLSPHRGENFDSVLFRIADDEAIAVRHLHLGQRLGVDYVFLADDLVKRENVGGDRVDLVVAERLRLLPRHGAPDEVEHRGGVGPVVADQLLRFLVWRVQRTAADQRAARPAAALVAVAGGAAVVGINLRALRGRAAAGRQTDAVRPDADVPRRQIGPADGLAEMRCVGGIGAGDAERK